MKKIIVSKANTYNYRSLNSINQFGVFLLI